MDNHPKTPVKQDTEVSLISRYEMLLMLENWLDWQKNCGTLYGKIDDPSLLQMKVPKPKSIVSSVIVHQQDKCQPSKYQNH